MNIQDSGINFSNTPPTGQYVIAPVGDQSYAPNGIMNQPNDFVYGNQYTPGYTTCYGTQPSSQQAKNLGFSTMNQPQPLPQSLPQSQSQSQSQPQGMTTNSANNYGYVTNPVNNQTTMMRPATPPSYKDYQAQIQTQAQTQAQPPNQNPVLTNLLQSLDSRLGKIES